MYVDLCKKGMIQRKKIDGERRTNRFIDRRCCGKINSREIFSKSNAYSSIFVEYESH